MRVMREKPSLEEMMSDPEQVRREQRIIEVLSSLKHQSDQLEQYLDKISCGLSQLLSLDWTVITLLQAGYECPISSNLDLGEKNQLYDLHGTLTETVIGSGRSLTIFDSTQQAEYGNPPEGYRSYLGVPLRTPQGQVIGTICSFCHQPREFTVDEVHTAELFAERAATLIDNYQLYEQLQQWNEQLEAEIDKRTTELQCAQAKLIANERFAAMGEFAETLVSQMRHSLGTAMQGLTLCNLVELSSASQERVSLATAEATRLDHLLDEILLYTKPNVLELIELDVNEFIQTLLPLLHTMPEVQQRHLRVIPVVPAVCIRGDRDKLTQVFINLIKNACEAIAPGETVTWSAHYSTSTGKVCIQVHNGGTPIPPDVLPHLTDPFYSTKPSGTGLGLAIVQRIVEAHNAELSLESGETGTRISIWLQSVEQPSLGS